MVTDVNEAPEFPAETATRSVAENTVPNANIGDPVVAMDVDDGDVLTYMLGDTADDIVRLPLCQPLGSCKPMMPLDYETKTDYEVTVTATDAGTGPALRYNHGHYQRQECLSSRWRHSSSEQCTSV